MKSLSLALLALGLVIAASPLAAQQKRASPHETISTVLGKRPDTNRVTVVYGRPYSKSPKTGEVRVIWGGLVPWEKAYRLGADESTLLITQKPLVFGKTVIPAGAYTIYMTPSEKGTSTLAFSSNLGTWGEPVDESHDVARVELSKGSLASDVDQLTIAVEKAAEGGVIKISWEKTQFSVPFTVQK